MDSIDINLKMESCDDDGDEDSSNNFLLRDIDPLSPIESEQSTSYNEGKCKLEKSTIRLSLPYLLQGNYFEIINQVDHQKVQAKCMTCAVSGIEKIINGHKNSTSNFISHLKRVHPTKYCDYLEDSKTKRSKISLNEKHYYLENQDEFDASLVNFIINNMQPLSIVEDNSFQTLLHTTMYPKEKKILTKKELKMKINEMFNKTKENLMSELNNISHCCTTADIWFMSDKSYIGITIHWIDLESQNRVSRILSCRRFNLPHTSERIMNHIRAINIEYGIENKVVATITDNRSNFGKVFNDFGISKTHHTKSDISDSSECEFTGDNDNESNSDSDSDLDDNNFNLHDIDSLPLTEQTHLRCATHTLSLIATEDALKALNHDSTYFKAHSTVFGKLNQLWTKSNQRKKSKQILAIFKSTLVLPVSTRWNSLYDAIQRILQIGTKQLNKLMHEFGLPKFISSDINFLKEYVAVLEPIALAIEHLRATNCYFAIFLPTIYSTDDCLQNLKSSKFQYCSALLNAIINGVQSRFEYLWDFRNENCIPALLATCSHPYFKLRWIPDGINTATNLQTVNEIMRDAVNGKDRGTRSNNRSDLVNELMGSAPQQEQKSKKFKYNFIKPQEQTSSKISNIQMEILSYMNSACADDEQDVEQLNQYHRIKNIFLKYNCITPSSAPVEQLFSFENMNLRSGPQRIEDNLYEKFLMIKSTQ